jgi:YHS domain-containing protein
VAHVFVIAGVGEVSPVFSAHDVRRDPQGALGRELGAIPEGADAPEEWTILFFGPQGRERFRMSSVEETGPAFVEFGRRALREIGYAPVEEYNLDDNKLAIGGYDPVAYFVQGEAREGKANIVSRYKGVNYRFASLGNRDRFAADPERYVPAYGGWCATAMAEGDKVGIDPETFKITDGRLFLFYYGWLGNAKKPWDKDEANLTVQADREWREIAGETAGE